jgi:hypothetical protein
MHRASRAITLSVVALFALGACKKKPQVAATPEPSLRRRAQPAPPPPSSHMRRSVHGSAFKRRQG